MTPKQMLRCAATGAVLVCAMELAAVTPVKQWDKRFGGSDFDSCYAIQQTSEGAFIMGGSSDSGADGDKTENSRGNYDYWILKTLAPPAT